MENGQIMKPVNSYHAIECEAFIKILGHLLAVQVAAGRDVDAKRICQIMLSAESISAELKAGPAVVMMKTERLEVLKKIIDCLEKWRDIESAQ